MNGCGSANRTRNLRVMSPALCQLSYPAGVHGSVLLSGGRGLLAQHFPRNVRPKFFASNLPVRGSFDGGAALGGHAVPEPGLHGLVPVVLDVEHARGCGGPPEDCDGSLSRELGRCLCVHAEQSTLDFLVLLDRLVFSSAAPHEKLARLDIHRAIKKRREALGLSMQELGASVAKLEGREKPLSWQTVQQWENGTSAPKRTRLEHVANALKTTPHDLIYGNDGGGQTARTNDMIELHEGEFDLLAAFRVLSPEERAEVLADVAYFAATKLDADIALAKRLKLIAEHGPQRTTQVPEHLQEGRKRRLAHAKAAKK